MIQSITSYFWGSGEEECQPSTPGFVIKDQMEENEWILIRPKDYYDGPASEGTPSENEDTWLVTPPQCFNAEERGNPEMSPIENLLIEHPSMSIYHGNDENLDEDGADTSELAVSKQETHKPVAGRLQQLEKRIPLKDINVKLIERKNASPKNLKRKNLVHVRTHNTRKNKQYGRMSGKHTALVGKRAS